MNTTLIFLACCLSIGAIPADCATHYEVTRHYVLGGEGGWDALIVRFRQQTSFHQPRDARPRGGSGERQTDRRHPRDPRRSRHSVWHQIRVKDSSPQEKPTRQSSSTSLRLRPQVRLTSAKNLMLRSTSRPRTASSLSMATATTRPRSMRSLRRSRVLWP